MMALAMLMGISGMNAASFSSPEITPEPLDYDTGLPTYSQLPSEVRICWGAPLTLTNIASKARLSNPDWQTINVTSSLSVVNDGANSYLAVDLSSYDIGPGGYVLEILDGAVKINGSGNNKVTAPYIVSAELGTDRIVSYPSKGMVDATELSEFTLTWPGYYIKNIDSSLKSEVNFAPGMISEMPENASSTSVELAQPGSAEGSAAYEALKVKLDKTYDSPGWYTLHLPANLLDIRSYDNPEKELTNEDLYLYYNINNFFTYPAQEGRAYGALSYIVIYGDNIQMAEGAKASDIKLKAERTETERYGVSVSEAEPAANGTPGLRINLN